VARSTKSLPELRSAIDDVDRRILELVTKRAELARAVGQAKVVGDRGVLDAGREKQVLAAIRKANRGPLRDEAV
jgi:chorismate mutase